jgi:aspartyl-tRNA(Asn)/glutamyl-tRNA(Gln) amidotransferase subunit B
MYRTGKDADTIIKEKSLIQITDEGILSRIIEKVMQENPKSVEEYRNGKEKALEHLVGQVMKLTQGKANPILVNKLLKEKTHQ